MHPFSGLAATVRARFTEEGVIQRKPLIGYRRSNLDFRIGMARRGGVSGALDLEFMNAFQIIFSKLKEIQFKLTFHC